jgi:hypothetical protein
LVADEWGELIVVAYEDEAVCVSQWPYAGWEGDLRCFIDDTVIEFPLIEDEATVSGGSGGTYWFIPRQVVATTRGEV